MEFGLVQGFRDSVIARRVAWVVTLLQQYPTLF